MENRNRKYGVDHNNYLWKFILEFAILLIDPCKHSSSGVNFAENVIKYIIVIKVEIFMYENYTIYYIIYIKNEIYLI